MKLTLYMKDGSITTEHRVIGCSNQGWIEGIIHYTLVDGTIRRVAGVERWEVCQ